MIYNYQLEDNTGKVVPMSDFKDKVIIIVNTATRCGFTPQYKELEAMYEKYKDKGLEIIDIPCNQFMNQAPGGDGEIQQFCSLNYNTTFKRMKKADVNGEHELPLYTYLKSQQGFGGLDYSLKSMGMSLVMRLKDWNYKKNADIKWNFTKFVVDRNGNVVSRFEPTDSMKELENKVVELLA